MSTMYCFLTRSLDMHTEKDHANKNGIYVEDTGHRLRKKYVINAARVEWPDGKESFSGIKLPSIVGRLLLVSAFSTTTRIMSSTNPEIIFVS